MKVVNKVKFKLGAHEDKEISLKPLTSFLVESIDDSWVRLRFNNKDIVNSDISKEVSWSAHMECFDNKANSIVQVSPRIFQMFFTEIEEVI
tara:strand:+ start:6551 stop:6823 length:273 start_codon:yes stop_codon:yes gene_type:complete